MDGIPEVLPWGLGTGFVAFSSLGSLALGKSLCSLLSLGSLQVVVVVVVVVFADGAFNFSVLSTETVPKLDVDDAEEARRSRTTPDNLESIAGVSFTVVLFFLGCFACVGASLLTLCTREGGTVAMVVVVVVVVVVVAAVRVVVVVVIVADIIVVMAATEVVELEADRLSSVLLPPIAGWFGIGSIFLKSGGSVWIFEG